MVLRSGFYGILMMLSRATPMVLVERNLISDHQL